MTTNVRLLLEVDGEQFEVFAKAVEHEAAAPAAAPAKRGRGRPAKGEDAPAPAPALAPAAVEADPFAATPTSAQLPTATLDEVRTALKALAAATTQANAVGVLKATSGVDNLSALKAEQYGAVAAAAKAALPKPTAVATGQQAEADPFETPAAAAPAVTLEQIKVAVVAAQKRTATDTVQALVMKHGGTAPKADGTGNGPSLKAIPAENYAAVLAAINALPATK